MRSSDAHHVLACDLIEKCQGNQMSDVWYGSQPRGGGWQSLQREIAQHGDTVEKVVLSSELFFGQSKSLASILDEVAHSLREHLVKVVVYLRRQDQLYSSFYNQDVKGMRQWPDSAYAFYETHQIFEIDYQDMLGMWSGVFGKENIIVRPFEPGQWPGGDIVRDFCTAIGIGPLSSRYKDRNESLGSTQLYLKRCLNRIGYDKQLNDDVLKVLARLCPEEPASSCQYIHRGLYRKYRQRWITVNKALADDYLQGKPLFNEPIPEADQVELYKVNQLKLAGSIENMVNVFRSGKYQEYRTLFAKAALLALAEYDLWYTLDSDYHTQLLKWV